MIGLSYASDQRKRMLKKWEDNIIHENSSQRTRQSAVAPDNENGSCNQNFETQKGEEISQVGDRNLSEKRLALAGSSIVSGPTRSRSRPCRRHFPPGFIKRLWKSGFRISRKGPYGAYIEPRRVFLFWSLVEERHPFMTLPFADHRKIKRAERARLLGRSCPSKTPR